MRILVVIAAWLAARAGAASRFADAGNRAAPWTETTADRAGQLVPAPQDGLVEPAVNRSLGASWALWLAVGVILLALAIGYVRRRWRRGDWSQPAWLTWRARR